MGPKFEEATLGVAAPHVLEEEGVLAPSSLCGGLPLLLDCLATRYIFMYAAQMCNWGEFRILISKPFP
jgi:hypothetical protein